MTTFVTLLLDAGSFFFFFFKEVGMKMHYCTPLSIWDLCRTT